MPLSRAVGNWWPRNRQEFLPVGADKETEGRYLGKCLQKSNHGEVRWAEWGGGRCGGYSRLPKMTVCLS